MSVSIDVCHWLRQCGFHSRRRLQESTGGASGTLFSGLLSARIRDSSNGWLMVIYGTALLSGCLIVGVIAGQLLGYLVGVDKNIGGVGIAMLLLIFVSDRLQRAGRVQPPTKQGILFWSSMYIPIVVAMAASQNVLAAVKGGPIALVAGVTVVLISFAMVPVISRIGQSEAELTKQENLSTKDEP